MLHLCTCWRKIAWIRPTPVLTLPCPGRTHHWARFCYTPHAVPIVHHLRGFSEQLRYHAALYLGFNGVSYAMVSLIIALGNWCHATRFWLACIAYKRQFHPLPGRADDARGTFAHSIQFFNAHEYIPWWKTDLERKGRTAQLGGQKEPSKRTRLSDQTWTTTP